LLLLRQSIVRHTYVYWKRSLTDY